MTDDSERPRFLPSFFAALAERAENGTLWQMFVAPLIAAVVGAVISYFIPQKFWMDGGWEVATTVYTGILTINGLILALSWSAFSRIYESVSAPRFCAFLRRQNLLHKYIVTVSYVHGLQLLAIIASGAGLLFLLMDLQYIVIDRILFAFMIFSSIYAIEQAASSVNIMHDLIWQKAIFDEDRENSENSSVVQMNKKKD